MGIPSKEKVAVKKLVALAVVITILSSAISCCPSATATPTGTVNAYLNALEAQDTQAMVGYFEENYSGMTRAQLTGTWETIFESIESYSVTNRKIEIRNQTETTAFVIASWDQYIVNTDGTIIDNSTSTGPSLIKVGGKWLISSR